DPPGVGARSLCDSLIIQARRKKNCPPHTLQLLKNHYDNFLNGRWQVLRKESGITNDELSEVIAFLRTLSLVPLEQPPSTALWVRPEGELVIDTKTASVRPILFHVLSSEFSYWMSFGKVTTQIPLGFSMALLGAGYLIGIASGIAILVGTLLAWGVFVPYLTSTLSPAEGQTAAAFAKAVWAQKVRFIGAGTIGIAAIWTLIKLLGPVIDGIKMSINAIRANDTAEKQALHHTDIDMSPKAVGL
ncbi:OPT/YSL family transporter, partial [Anaeroglobus sp. AF13-6AC]|uniref:OPT/YSL family transporter n=1 Tax=Anaeroglobus sp. AF13-6AC TaxID=2997918 RepID=UPI0022E1CF98